MGENLSTAPSPLPSPYPQQRDTTLRYSTFGIISAILGLFILPEILGSAAIILGAYTWRKQQGNFGLYVLILGIICVIVGIEVTAYFWLGSLLLD